jgi:hypothetical protein
MEEADQSQEINENSFIHENNWTLIGTGRGCWQRVLTRQGRAAWRSRTSLPMSKGAPMAQVPTPKWATETLIFLVQSCSTNKMTSNTHAVHTHSNPTGKHWKC